MPLGKFGIHKRTTVQWSSYERLTCLWKYIRPSNQNRISTYVLLHKLTGMHVRCGTTKGRIFARIVLYRNHCDMYALMK